MKVALTPLIGRPTFNAKNVSAGNRELGIWLAWGTVSRQLVMQRQVFAGLYHAAFSFDREIPHLRKYIARGQNLIDKLYRDGHGNEQYTEAVERHVSSELDYEILANSTSRRSAESLIYAFDGPIKFAADAARLKRGDKDVNLIGGKYLVEDVTLIEAIRSVANWQRHAIEWDGYNERNYNHRVLKKLGLWKERFVPLAFLKSLKRPSYFNLERDLYDGLGYLVCEQGMRQPL